MCRCTITSKVFLAALSLLFWFCAAGLIFIGAWVYKEYQQYDQISEAVYTLVPAAIIMAVGGFLFLVGIFGCVGAFKENKCVLGMYFTTLLLILMAVLTAAVLGYIFRGQIKTAVKKGINDGLQHYQSSQSWKSQVDFMQKQLKCCGNHNYTDWMNTPWHINTTKDYPDSCCPNEKCTNVHVGNTTEGNVYKEGCFLKMEAMFVKHLGVIIGVAVGFAVIQILGMVFACVLLCRKKEYPYMGLGEAPGGMSAGLRV